MQRRRHWSGREMTHRKLSKASWSKLPCCMRIITLLRKKWLLTTAQREVTLATLTAYSRCAKSTISRSHRPRPDSNPTWAPKEVKLIRIRLSIWTCRLGPSPTFVRRLGNQYKVPITKVRCTWSKKTLHMKLQIKGRWRRTGIKVPRM